MEDVMVEVAPAGYGDNTNRTANLEYSITKTQNGIQPTFPPEDYSPLDPLSQATAGIDGTATRSEVSGHEIDSDNDMANTTTRGEHAVGDPVSLEQGKIVTLNALSASRPTYAAVPEVSGTQTSFSSQEQSMLQNHADAALSMTQESLDSAAEDPGLDGPPSVVESEGPRIQGFAKLEFTDGEFYMNTYSVEIGRDVHAARLAEGRDFGAIHQADTKPRHRSWSSGEVSQNSGRPIGTNGRHTGSSVVSESGGVIAMGQSDSDLPRKRRRKRTKSATSSSQQLSRKSSFGLPSQRIDYQSLAMASLDPRSSLPLPEACPLVPIHPPAPVPGIPSSHKSISRKHVKIAFNFEKHLFEIIILGRNGAFVDEEWYPEGDVQPLRSGSLIQIGGVGIRFVLPDVAMGETGADASDSASSDNASIGVKTRRQRRRRRQQRRRRVNSSEIDDEDEDEEENDVDDDDEDNGSRDEDEDRDNEENDSDEVKSEDEELREPKSKSTKAGRPVRAKKPVRKELSKPSQPTKGRKPVKANGKATVDEVVKPDLAAPPPKRKGPGRPPKNGICSKREQALMAKKAREEAKAGLQADAAGKLAGGKGKSIWGTSEVKPEGDPLQPPAKRKYKKRKTKAEIEAGEREAARESTEHTDSIAPDQLGALASKPSKPAKPAKPPRSPSPVFDEATLTPEQLAKPQASYVILIHEALTNSKTGQMSLPQIYRAIERKYPYFKLRVQTQGWQSSVRHNLGQHPAFRKIERDGKGWMWGLVPEVSIEKERKRRMTPPVPQHNYFPPAPHMMQHSFQHPGVAPPPPSNAPLYYAQYAGYHSGMPPPPQQNPYRPLSSPHPPPPMPNGFPLPLSTLQPETPTTYQSPYGSAPPKTDNTSGQSSGNGEEGQPQPAKSESALKDENRNDSAPQPHPTDFPSSHPNGSHPKPLPSTEPLSSNRQQSPFSSNLKSAPPASYNHSPAVLQVVQLFREKLLSSMAGSLRAEALITSAIRLTLGTGEEAEAKDAVKEEDPELQAVVKVLRDMVRNVRDNSRHVGDGGSFSEKERGGELEKDREERESGAGGGSEGVQPDEKLMQILEEVSKTDVALEVGDEGEHQGQDEGQKVNGDGNNGAMTTEKVNGELHADVDVNGNGQREGKADEEQAPL